MLNALFTFIASIRNYIEAILAAFPKSSIALVTLAAALLSKFGFNVSVDQLTSIVSAVVLLISILTHHAQAAVAAREAEAKPAGK